MKEASDRFEGRPAPSTSSSSSVSTTSLHFLLRPQTDSTNLVQFNSNPGTANPSRTQQILKNRQIDNNKEERCSLRTLRLLQHATNPATVSDWNQPVNYWGNSPAPQLAHSNQIESARTGRVWKFSWDGFVVVVVVVVVNWWRTAPPSPPLLPPPAESSNSIRINIGRHRCGMAQDETCFNRQCINRCDKLSYEVSYVTYSAHHHNWTWHRRRSDGNINLTQLEPNKKRKRKKKNTQNLRVESFRLHFRQQQENFDFISIWFHLQFFPVLIVMIVIRIIFWLSSALFIPFWNFSFVPIENQPPSFLLLPPPPLSPSLLRKWWWF